MKYLKKYKLFESVNEDIHDLCKKYGIRNYTINEDLSIDVEGNVDLRFYDLTKLPIKFRNVSGGFACSHNILTSLEGAPNGVGGDFDCQYNQLTSLEGAPNSVGGYFSCYSNQLTSLEGAPSGVGGNFYCYYNQLTSLKGAPSVGGDFYCRYNQLTSLNGLEWKSFRSINLGYNPVYPIVKDWVNNEDREELIEYFIDMNVIQEGKDKPKLIFPRLEAFYEDMELEMNIDFGEVKKYYEIIEG